MASKKLILLRHGKSDWQASWQTDEQRPINARGQSDAKQIGKWLQTQALTPQVILCSSAIRTQQTMECMLEKCRWPKVEITLRDDLYLATAGEMLYIAQHALHQSDVVMIIGHNNGIEELLLFLCATAPRTKEGKVMTTATCAVIEFADDDDVFEQGELTQFIRGKDVSL